MKGKKLYEIIENREYAIIETIYGIHSIDITYEDDYFDIKYVEKVPVATLKDRVTNCISQNGEYSPEDMVHIWEGTVCGVTKEESVMVYVPENWD